MCTIKITKEALYQQAQEEGYTQEQLNALMGSLMGDGALRKSGKMTKAFMWNHGWNQHEYNLHKYQLLQEHATREPFRKENTGYGEYWSVLTLKSSKTFHLLYVLTHPDGVAQKTITKEYLDMIDHPIALAWWFMDDGTRQAQKNYGNILTNGFTEEEVLLISSWLKDYWGVQTTPSKTRHTSTGKEATTLLLPKKGYLALMELINSYIPSCMEYKTKVVTTQCAYCGNVMPKSAQHCCCPACAEAYRKIAKSTYYQNNKEHLREKSRQWKAAHRAQINKRAREAYLNLSPVQREKLAEYQRAYAEKNKDKINARKRAWRQRMKGDPAYEDRLKAERKRYYDRLMADPVRKEHKNAVVRARKASIFAQNPEKVRDQQRAYRARLKEDPERRKKQLERDRLAAKKRKERMTPEQLELKRLKNKERYNKRMQKIKADPVLYEEYKKKQREKYAQKQEVKKKQAQN